MDHDLRRKDVREELRVLIAALSKLGLEFESEEIADLEFDDLVELRDQFRDALHSLGG